MKRQFAAVVLVMALSLCATVLPAAEDQPVEGATEAATKPSWKNAEKRKREIAEKRKAYAKTKFVDINSASKEELTKLPGIDGAAADRIVAGRPYGSKAWLVTHKVVPEGIFHTIKDRIVAKQSFKSAADVDAAYGKQK